VSKIEDILDLSVQDALKLKEGSVLRQFPSEFLGSTVREVILKAKAGDQKARSARKVALV